MLRFFAFNLLFLLALPGISFSQEIPVLLMIKRSEQSDTSGCNFVEQLSGLVYDEVLANRVKLWDSQKKDIQITGTTLQSIEKASGVNFRDQETIFIYEMWDNSKREVISKTIGFSFVQRGNTAEEVSFGYVDFSDLRETFMKTRVNTNASGLYSATFTTYMLSKNFAYNIVQFGGKPVRSTGESDDILKSFVGALLFNQTLLGYYPPDKYVSYIIDHLTEGSDSKAENSKKLLRKIEDYLLQNQEVFFNMGGDKVVSHIQKNKFKVTRIELREIWRKVESAITYDPRSMVIYVNDTALNEMNGKAIMDFEVNLDDKSLTEFLKEKQYNFIITQINSQTIPRKDSFLYYRALMTAEWNKVIQFVVNY
jgi:hypothetical protein